MGGNVTISDARAMDALSQPLNEGMPAEREKLVGVDAAVFLPTQVADGLSHGHAAAAYPRHHSRFKIP